jgi:alkyl hydroperoxide reductase subunit AhpC
MRSVELKMLQELVPRFKELSTAVLGISTNDVITHAAWKLHIQFTFPCYPISKGR